MDYYKKDIEEDGDDSGRSGSGDLFGDILPEELQQLDQNLQRELQGALNKLKDQGLSLRDLVKALRNLVNSGHKKYTSRVPGKEEEYEKEKKQQQGPGAKQGIKKHPILGDNARMHGTSDANTAINVHSEIAQEEFDNRSQPSPQNQPQNQLAHQKQQEYEMKMKKGTTPTR